MRDRVPTYAVNVLDLTRLPEITVQLLLKDYASPDSPIVDAEPGRIDGMAVVLDGPAARERQRVEALVDLLLGVFSKRAGAPIRVYQQGPRGGWRRVRRGEVRECPRA